MSIVAITGAEGSGKTLLMTYLALQQAREDNKLFTFPGYTVFAPQKRGGCGPQLSQPLETEDWISLSPELSDCTILIDESQNFFGSSKYMTTLNSLFASFAMQRRHRNLTLILTIQNFEWLDKRLRWLVHTLATTYDIFWTNYGRENNIGRGELISVTFFDMKGFATGNPGQQSAPFMLKGKPLWDCYDSYADVDLWAGLSRVKVIKPEYTVDLTGGGPAKTKPRKKSDISNADLLNQFVELGATPQQLSTLTRRLSQNED